MSAAANQNHAAAETHLVYGLGATGISVARHMQREGVNAKFVDSRNDPPGAEELQRILPDAVSQFGKTPKKLLDNVSRVIVSPGIADSDSFLKKARKAGVEVVSDIQLFADAAPAPLVAITGSNGKSTVTTLLALMCEAAGKTVYAGGNLGTPALDLLAKDRPDFYILELSSFQLQRTSKLPAKASVLLNVSPDHLDWHGSEEAYRDAKLRVFAHAEAAVINRAEAFSDTELPESLHCVTIGLDEPDADQYGLLEEDGQVFLARGDQPLLATDDLALVGLHNCANALAALACGELLGLDLAAMLQVLHEFPGLPHRMQALGSVRDVHYINDSKATNVGAAIASVESIDGFIVLIAGGQGKGGDFEKLARATCARLRAVVLIGEDAELLAEAYADLAPVLTAGSMDRAVQMAADAAQLGDTVLLAPACASFDQYDNYQYRGDDFCKHVAELPQ